MRLFHPLMSVLLPNRFFHCHIDWHLVMGMAVAFYYDDIPNTVPEPDLNLYSVCGDVTPQVVVNHVTQNQPSQSPTASSTTQESPDESEAPNSETTAPPSTISNGTEAPVSATALPAMGLVVVLSFMESLRHLSDFAY